MKKSLIAKMAVAALLVLGSLSNAQEKKTPVPTEDNPVSDQAKIAGADSQESASDKAVVGGEAEPVAPIQPIEDSSLIDSNAAVGSSDCIGCGQATPTFGAPPTIGCVGCGSSCTGCATNSIACYVQPINNCDFGQIGCCQIGCSQTGCGQIGQVVYDQPIYQGPIVSSVPTTTIATPVSVMTGANSIVNPAPLPMTSYAPIQSGGCTTCVTPMATSAVVTSPMNVTYVSGGCENCGRSRGRLRGRIFRNR